MNKSTDDRGHPTPDLVSETLDCLWQLVRGCPDRRDYEYAEDVIKRVEASNDQR